MALAKVLSCAVVGLDGELVEVEVDVAQGMPAFAIVGLPDAAVQEAGRQQFGMWWAVYENQDIRVAQKGECVHEIPRSAV